MTNPNEMKSTTPPKPAGDGSISLKDAFAMARQSHHTGEPARAEALYCLILTRAPDHAGTMHFLGTVVFQQDRPIEAEKITRKAIQFKPDIAANYNNLGCILAQQDRLSKATAAFQKALQLEPDYADVRNNFARVYL